MARGPIEPMPAMGALEGIAKSLFMAATRREFSGCLKWLGATGKVGDRRYPTWRFRGNSRNAARWAWHLFREPIDKPDVQLIRTCETELCVEPTHFRIKQKAPKLAAAPAPTTRHAEKTWTAGLRRPKPGRHVGKLKAVTPVRHDHVELRADWTVSLHARQRATELGFTLNDVYLAVEHPEVTYVSSDEYGKSAFIHQRGDCAVAVLRDRKVVQTVLLRRTDEWLHGRDRRNA